MGEDLIKTNKIKTMVGHLIKTTKPEKNHGSTFDKTTGAHSTKTTEYYSVT